MLNIPRGAVSEEALLDSLHGVDEAALLGPSKGISAHLSEEDEEGNIVVRDDLVNSLVVDFSDDVLPFLREYDPSAPEENPIMPFVPDTPNALPVFAEIVDLASAWIAQQGSDRVNFYSAQEDPVEPVGKAVPEAKGSSKKSPAPKRVTNAQVLDQLSVLVAQVQSLSARQDALESQPAKVVSGPPAGSTAAAQSVSAGLNQHPAPMQAFAKYTQLVGPPPKVRAAVPKLVVPNVANLDHGAPPVEADGTDLVQAINHQSTAMLALVSQIAGGSDPLSELTAPGHLSTSTKGVQRRERMQSDLAQGSSNYYLHMMQQLHKKLCPGKPLPKNESELAHLSFLEYLEKTGGYRAARESGLLMWLIGHCIDAAAVEDHHLCRERLALLAIALEQSVIDKGDWSVAFLLSLAADPPLQMFADRTSVVSPFGQPFSNLVPPSWAANVLSYIKELEVLSNKKADQVVPKKKKEKSSDA